MKSKNIISISAISAVLAAMAFGSSAYAATTNQNSQFNRGMRNGAIGERVDNQELNRGVMALGVSGKVTGVNGSTITVSGRQGLASSTTAVVYTVNATNAIVHKNNATTTVSSIVVGDTILVQGTVTGNNVVATFISDGAFGRMMGSFGDNTSRGANGRNDNNGRPNVASSTMQKVIGNGQPIVAGTVSAISGNSLTVSTASNVTYTVDTSGAKFMKGSASVTVSNVVIGDKVMVQGTMNGTSVIATTVIDQSAPANNVGTTTPRRGDVAGGFFGGIGKFFMRIFGF
jgi:hypothetical protein